MAHTETQRRAYLDALGIARWERRPVAGAAAVTDSGIASGTDAGVSSAPPAGHGDGVLAPAGPLLAESETTPSGVVTDTERAAHTEAMPVARLDWSALAQRVAACTACALHRTRHRTVFGVGDRAAQWMVIGEAPGADEDRQGEPFVGRAGQLLDNMLLALGLQREQVYIANILKCRPPKNRDPQPDEVAQCEAYLARQVALVRPRLILAVGRIAAHHLLNTTAPLGSLRGQCHHYADVPVVVTYHPAYLLRSPQDKRKAWEDLQYAQRIVDGRL